MNIKDLGVLVLAGLVILAAPQARAEDQGHAYLLVAVGNSETERRVSDVDAIQGDATSFELGVGYAFNPYVSIEGSYQSFGKPDGFAGCPADTLCIAIVPFAREDVEVDGWSAAVKGSLPINETFSAFARAGLLAWDASARTAALNDSGTDLFYGAGVAARLSERLSVEVSYEDAEVDIESIRLGFRVSF